MANFSYTVSLFPGTECICSLFSRSKFYITESCPLKHVGRKKWGIQDALCAHKGFLPLSVPFDFKHQNSQKGVLLSRFETMGAVSIVIKCKNVLIFDQC